jgi:hypothetical protein
VEPNSVWKETNAEGVPISYACEYQTGSDWTQLPETLEVANVVQFYDLVFPCGNSDTKQNAADYIAQQLLLQAAETWKILPDGEGCMVPQNEYNSWLFGVSTGPEPDVFISDFGCQAETVDAALDECCQVVRMTIQFLPTGDYDVDNLQDFVREQLAGTLAVASLPLRTTPIDPVFAPPNVGPDVVVLPPSDGTTGAAGMTNSTGSVEQKSASSGGITVPGGFLLAALICAVFGVVAVLVRRHRRRGNHNPKAADDGTFENGPSSGDDEPFRVSVLSDDADDCFLPALQQQQHYHQQQQQQQQEQPLSPPMQSTSHRLASGALSSTGSLDIDNMSLEEDDCIVAPKKYAFDLSQSFKNDVMGTYGFGGTRSHPFAGPTTMPVVAPYPLLDETSDSEVDSWAQTDATVGSLEERLEEITAEI